MQINENLINTIFWVLYMFQVPTMLHIMQQESYQNDGMYRWIGKNIKKAFKAYFIGLIGTLLAYFLSIAVLTGLIKKDVSLNANMTQFIVFSSQFAFLIIYYTFRFIVDHKERKNAKKPLKYTARAKRLMVYNFFVVVIVELLFLQSFNVEYKYAYYPLIFALLIFVLPANMIISNWLVSPLEQAIGRGFIKKAYRKLHQKEYKNLIKIGITGSYGKTSTKFILKTILQEKYNVLATPGSFNTTMGNVRVIREQLLPEHEVFISEMGARKINDIHEICEFVQPHIGIITSIGEQHLETFKTIDNVAKTKGELLEGTLNINNPKSLISDYDSAWTTAKMMMGIYKKEEAVDAKLARFLEDGAVFLCKDGAKCEELYEKDSHNKKYLFAVNDEKADVYAKNIKATTEGSEFTIVSKKYKEYKAKTKLLGVHNVQNIMGAVAIAEYLGLTKEQIQNGISKIEPVEHRLQLLPSTNGTIVIDDAFNSNPVGSKAALDVIKQINGRKIIITPGMVELGEKEDELNHEFGRQMADAVDIAILVGPVHTKPIQDALKENKFESTNIYVVRSLNEATEQLGKIAKAGDVILFENDLPDSYNE